MTHVALKEIATTKVDAISSMILFFYFTPPLALLRLGCGVIPKGSNVERLALNVVVLIW